MAGSVYIHIPFCKSKCHYCSFVSFNKLNLKNAYIDALIKEIKAKYKNEPLNTLYFGGGTPSLLTPEEFKRIISLFNINSSTEITTELNPETLNRDYLNKLRQTGINRISLGCQTFDDEILKLINRRHNSQQVISSVKDAQKEGFDNISLDFIYGLPKQTMDIFINDLKKAMELNVQHISLYGLQIENGCYFSAHPPSNLADDDLQADMYLNAVEVLKSSGYEHYEISNFSLEGCNSRHNLNYWNNNEYYGFGTSAHGYIDSVRYSNAQTIESYINNPLEPENQKLITQKEKLEEEIFLGFRKSTGINIENINQKFNIDFEKKYEKTLIKYTNFGFLQKKQGEYYLTPKGYLISNTILAEFL